LKETSIAPINTDPYFKRQKLGMFSNATLMQLRQ
jgi:hypothetical protein